MDQLANDLSLLTAALKKANGRRSKRLLSMSDLVDAVVDPEIGYHIVRDHSVDPPAFRRGRYVRKKQGKTTAALLFEIKRMDRTERFAIIRAITCTSKNGFTDVIWNQRWRKGVTVQSLLTQAVWVPTSEDLAVYSDYLEECGQKRVA